MKKETGVFNISFGKRGQFFILSAVIISVIIVSMVSVKNSVSTGEAPRKFYYYSEQLKDETGAVVDWALYNSQDATNIEDFVQLGIEQSLAGYPTMEIVSCWTKPGVLNQNWLICQNNGTKSVVINSSTTGSPQERITLNGSNDDSVKNWICPLPNPIQCNLLRPKTSGEIYIENKKYITINHQSSTPYNLQINNASIQTGQFYFIFRTNTTAGDYVTDSTQSPNPSAYGSLDEE